jgi:hypothetical protein
MRVHKDVEMVQLNVDLPKDVRAAFVEVCHRHHTTSCHVLYSLIKAFIEGEKRGLVDLSTKNPVTVQVVNLFAAHPRGHGKYDAAYMPAPVPGSPAVLCLYCDGFREGEVFCQRYGADWIPASKCSTCPKNRFQKKGEFRA